MHTTEGLFALVEVLDQGFDARGKAHLVEHDQPQDAGDVSDLLDDLGVEVDELEEFSSGAFPVQFVHAQLPVNPEQPQLQGGQFLAELIMDIAGKASFFLIALAFHVTDQGQQFAIEALGFPLGNVAQGPVSVGVEDVVEGEGELVQTPL